MHVHADAQGNHEKEWRALAGAATAPPFLSLAWQSAVRGIAGSSAPVVASIGSGNRIVAMASLGRGVERRARFIRSRVLYLNETGDPELDRMLVEHNRLLSEPGQEAPSLEALVRHLLRGTPGWDELSLGWQDAERWAGVAAALPRLSLRMVIRERQPYFLVDLAGVDGEDAYLACLSGNTRQQIRRAMRGYRERGPLAYHVAASPEETLAWFRELVALHQEEWQRRGRSGAFASTRVRRFHETFLPAAFEAGTAEIGRVQAGDSTVGYLYSLSDGVTLYNYQSGLVFEADAKLKPGLVAHTLAIADAARRGYGRYDLLMGDSQYKRSLSTRRGEMVRVVLQRPRLRFLVERALRGMQARLARGRA